jgi:hypothetical protein
MERRTASSGAARAARFASAQFPGFVSLTGLGQCGEMGARPGPRDGSVRPWCDSRTRGHGQRVPETRDKPPAASLRRGFAEFHR